MSIALQNSLSNSTQRIKSHFLKTPQFHFTKPPNFPILHNPFQSLQFNRYPFHQNLYLPIKAYDSPPISIEEIEKNPSKSSSFDAFLSVMESICVISSSMITLGNVVNWVYFKQYNSGLVLMGSKVLVFLLAGAVAVGSVIRRRQWVRVFGSRSRSKPGFESGNVIDRIERLEESMRSSSSIIRMLSRQVEKLGIRFRVIRMSIKDPISEVAALAQKNSEATCALGVNGDHLEKELAEVQNVLLAMQDQQQKQLELILAIAKRGKLLENKPIPSQGDGMNKKELNHSPAQINEQPIQGVAGQKTATNNKVIGS